MAAAGFSRNLQEQANPSLAPPPGLPEMPCRLACPAASAMPPSAFPPDAVRPKTRLRRDVHMLETCGDKKRKREGPSDAGEPAKKPSNIANFFNKKIG